MAVLRPVGRFSPHAERPTLRALQPVPRAVSEEEEWQPEVLRLSRMNDEREVLLVNRVHGRIAAAIGWNTDNVSPEAIRAFLAEQSPIALEEERLSLNRADRLRLQDAVLAEIVGYGPIQDLVLDDTVSEIMVNGPRQVWIERDGKLFLTDIVFADNDHILRIIQRIVAPPGRRCDESSPMVDARLPDGSRVNSIIPPLSLVGPTLTIRKFRRVPFGPQELLANGTITQQGLQFLRACVQGRLNIVVAGGTGAGKTTLLNSLSSYISARERIVTIEDAAEVRLQPDRIVIGECRGAEALDMLQAMNTGHDGSITTIHANGPRDALSRIETMVLMSGADLPLRAIREQAVAALDLVVFIERLQDGTRRVTQISEVRGLEGEVITMQDIFAFHRDGFDGERVVGGLRPTGIRPSFNDKLAARGVELPASWFGYEPEGIRAK